MHGLLDGFLVGGALLASVLYAICALGPRSLKRNLLARAVVWVRSVPATPALRSLLRRLETAAAIKPAGACGGCDECVSAARVPASNGPTTSEIKIPVSTIGKR